MTSNASIEDFTLLRIRGPVIATVPPGRDTRPVSGHARLLTWPRMITGWREEAGCG